ncbi:hypothetical protein MBLNU459_g8494t1 [Dothideomycetes sp. NU459]
MIDPFPIPAPLWLQRAVQPLADRLSLPTLPLHVHEVLIALVGYHVLHTVISPRLSTWLCPQSYPKFNKRTAISWDVHVVSLAQSLLVNSFGLYMILGNQTRSEMNWAGRIWGYDGASGMLQGLAGGYFLWDLYMCTRYINIFGVGMLLHAISAVTVFSLGFRPFLNYYGPVFILYELSSPFLNVHWFMDKLKMTGSTYQMINGIALIITFFGCRLVWGSINSVLVFRDIWTAMNTKTVDHSGFVGQSAKSVTTRELTGDIMQFAGSYSLPTWLALSYLVSNIVLNVLNYYWFGKMIETIRKRFDPPFGTKGTEKSEKKEAETKTSTPEIEIQRGVYADGRKTVEIGGSEVRNRRRG